MPALHKNSISSELLLFMINTTKYIMKRAFYSLILACSFFSYLKPMIIIKHEDYLNKAPQRAYELLVKNIGYDPEVKSFHHLRRLIFNHSKGKFGQRYFERDPITGYHHGINENGDCAYQFCVDNIIQNAYTFDFPKQNSNPPYFEQKKRNAKISLHIAHYIKALYKAEKIDLFGTTQESLNLFLYLIPSVSIYEGVSVNFYKSNECIQNNFNNKCDDDIIIVDESRGRALVKTFYSLIGHFFHKRKK